MAKIQIVAAILFTFATTHVQAQSTLQVTVFDKQGAPLPQAVVSIATSQHAASQTLQRQSQTATMDQVNRLFDPFILVVQQGDTVTFPNSDNIRHQVYSFSQTKPFELPLYSNTESPSLRFNEAGIVVLGCNIHDHMKAYIYVSPYEQSVLTNAQGQAQLAVGATSLSVWYPGISESPAEAMTVPVAANQTTIQVQLPVLVQSQNPPPPSALQQRFNRLRNNN